MAGFAPFYRFLMAYAIIKTGGKQYRVAAGDVILVEKLEVPAGGETNFSDVLFYADGDAIKSDASALEGANVVGEVVAQVKGEKVIAFKYRRRKGYHRTVGHRQKLTKVKITAINA
ncbi:MAG TPA: 50S ribosomal protein L21 [Chthoniobacteraceae bacterium]|nr:50S ribosomal protein L21 [Chthoniobacteraceae bacterium]